MPYEYKFVEVPTVTNGLKTKPGESFEKCKSVIQSEAKDGWRLKQVVAHLMKNWAYTARWGTRSFLRGNWSSIILNVIVYPLSFRSFKREPFRWLPQ